MKKRSVEQAETRKRERGSILATSAIGMLSILLAVGLGVDISRFYLDKDRTPERGRCSSIGRRIRL